jgi:hypothetical protein
LLYSIGTERSAVPNRVGGMEGARVIESENRFRYRSCMEHLRKDVVVRVRLPDYKDQLIGQIGKHIADLTQGLRALQEGTFVKLATSKAPQSVFHVEYAGLDVEGGAEQRHVQGCFRAVIAAFITYLDQMIAMQRMSETGIPIHRNLSETEALPYVNEFVQRAITSVATDRSMTNPRKIESFAGLSEWAKQSANGMFALRRCYEHHGGIAESAFSVPYKAMRLFAGDDEITALPHQAAEDQAISLRFIDKMLVVKTGERPVVGEQQLRDLVNTIELAVATEILLSVEKRLASKGLAGVESKPTVPW